MWVLRTKVESEDALIIRLARDNRISFSGYPIKHFNDPQRHLLQVCGFVDGTDAEVTSFLRVLSREKRVVKMHSHHRFVVALLEFDFLIESLYEPGIIFLKPMRYTKAGIEYMEIASWEKEPLMDVIADLEKHYLTTITSFHQEDIKDISVISYNPHLTEKQRISLELAINSGYYDYPKKITLKELAAMMDVSFSTYRAHLSKAESKFIPMMYRHAYDKDAI